MKVRLSNIQRFCLTDGPGIRTTVFLKGCNLNCPWCANPENIDHNFTKYTDEDGDEKVFGYDIDIDDLYEELIKDKEYFKLNDGGVTFSGGEPLLQIKNLEPLLKKLKENNINICFETALEVPSELVKIALAYADEFIIDVKILDKEKAKKVLNGNIDLYYKNLNLIKNNIGTFRIPVTKEYTLEENHINELLRFFKKFPCKQIEIFKIHNFAQSKYKALNKPMKTFKEVTDNDLENLKNEIKKINKNVKIIKF